MSTISNYKTTAQRKIIDNHVGDSMIAFGIGIAICFWFFNALIRFIDSPDLSLKMIIMGTELQLYEKLAVSTLFIAFGSHAKTNIKKRRHAEDNLQESDEKYRIILESIEEGYYEIDFNGNFQFINKSMCKILTRTENEIIGTSIISHLDKKDIKDFQSFFKKIRNNKKHSSTIECGIKTKGGGRKTIEMSAALMANFNSPPDRFRGVVRDVTEKKLLENNLFQSLDDVKEARSGIVLGLAKLSEYRDTDTGRHLERIREYSKVIAKEMSKLPQYSGYITPQYIEDIYQSSILHDIGKVGVPDAILLKKGKLTDEEYEQIKNHTLLGGQALSSITKQFKDQTFLTIAKEIAYYHHEKWNGKGYPSQLKGKRIPLSARIVAIADVYDALTSKRCYKKEMSHTKSKEIIIDEKGEIFDPDVVNAFLASENQIKKIWKTLHKDDVEPDSMANPANIHQEYDF